MCWRWENKRLCVQTHQLVFDWLFFALRIHRKLVPLSLNISVGYQEQHYHSNILGNNFCIKDKVSNGRWCSGVKCRTSASMMCFSTQLQVFEISYTHCINLIKYICPLFSTINLKTICSTIKSLYTTYHRAS